mmetsp:Transcript_31465/g.50777  ORF Transcript_31465/g.50777 Transcript_31465/m.50777 type:complete len:160 (+) Transcript_31465:2633-3112(+)
MHIRASYLCLSILHIVRPKMTTDILSKVPRIERKVMIKQTTKISEVPALLIALKLTWSKWNESGVFYLEVVPDNELRLFQSVEKEKVFEIQSISKLIRGVGLLHYLEEIRQLSLKAKQLMAASMSTWLDICKKIELPEQEVALIWRVSSQLSFWLIPFR